ncbi:MAG: hypothetical protein KDD73_13345, partial [Anaerolineales bacterium]|nr:hypothetical protein [Anaerolineales bacterium]
THSKMRWAARAADLRGWDVMAEHMHHFLDNSGEPLDVSVDDMLSDMPEFQARVDQQSQVVMNQMINQEIANSYDGTPMTFEVTTPWLSDYYPDKSDYPDWYYGVGGFSYAQSATVTVTPNPAGGDPIVTVTSQTHMFDRYNWDAGKSVTLPSTGIDWIDDHTMAGDYIPDTQMGRLHGTGIAQEYELHGSSSKRVTTYHYDPNTGLQPPPSTDNGGR